MVAAVQCLHDSKLLISLSFTLLFLMFKLCVNKQNGKTNLSIIFYILKIASMSRICVVVDVAAEMPLTAGIFEFYPFSRLSAYSYLSRILFIIRKTAFVEKKK
jgi:hypothetical protein